MNAKPDAYLDDEEDYDLYQRWCNRYCTDPCHEPSANVSVKKPLIHICPKCKNQTLVVPTGE